MTAEKIIVEKLHDAVKKIIQDERNKSYEYLLDLRERINTAERDLRHLDLTISQMKEVLKSKAWAALVKETQE